MKKFYTILAISAAIAAVGCTKVNVDENATPDRKIGYQVANYATQTRSGSETSFLDELSDLGITTEQFFMSKAYINADNGAGSTVLSEFYSPNPDSIKWNATSTEWEPSKDYYWPKSPNSNLDFFSWYDFKGVAPSLTYNGTTATLAWTNRTVYSKDDVLYANVAWHQNKNLETYQLDGVSEGVPTLFHHALAQVKFAAKIKAGCDKKLDSKNPGDSTFWTVILSEVKIAASSVHNNGTLSLSITDPETKTNSTTWTLPSNSVWANAADPAYVGQTDWFTTDFATGVDSLTLSYNNLSDTEQMPNGFITVRPQAVTDAMKLTFKMTIKSYYGSSFAAAVAAGVKTTEVIPVTAFSTTAADAYTANGLQLNKITGAPAYWAMNTKTVYNIIIDPSTSTILYDPAVEPWANETDNEIEVPKPEA